LASSYEFLRNQEKEKFGVKVGLPVPFVLFIDEICVSRDDFNEFQGRSTAPKSGLGPVKVRKPPQVERFLTALFPSLVRTSGASGA